MSTSSRELTAVFSSKWELFKQIKKLYIQSVFFE